MDDRDDIGRAGVRMDDRTMTPAKALRNGGHGRAHDHDLTNRSHHDTPPEGSWEAFRGVGDPDQKYSIWRLCPCPDCGGRGKHEAQTGRIVKETVLVPRLGWQKCAGCRGEGKQRQLLATCATAAAMGVAIETLADEGEFQECPIGLLRDGQPRGTWLVLPWLPSPRNASDAGRLLRRQR